MRPRGSCVVPCWACYDMKLWKPSSPKLFQAHAVGTPVPMAHMKKRRYAWAFEAMRMEAGYLPGVLHFSFQTVRDLG